MSRRKKLLFAFILATLLVLVTAILAELSLRLLYPMPWYGYEYLPPQKKLFMHDREIGWVGRPNTDDFFAGIDFKTAVHHDANGFRNHNPFYDKNKKNVLILGDSFGWGWGVRDDDIVSEAITAQDSDVNAYNLAAPGYGTDQELLILKRFLAAHPDYRPDLVVQLFYENDFEDNMFFRRYGYLKPRFDIRPNGELVLTGTPVAEEGPQVFSGERKPLQRPRSFGRNFHLYNLMKFYGQYRRFPHTEIPPMPRRALTPEERQQIGTAVRLTEEIRETAKSRGAPLLVVAVFPFSDPRYPPFYERLAQQGFDYVRFDRVKLPLNELWNDHHMNAWGHGTLAREILKHLP